MKNSSVRKAENGYSSHLSSQKAGFWRRTCAVWLDFLVVYTIVWVVFKIAQLLGIYIAKEITFIILLMIYSTVLTIWKGRTPGKFLCGLSIQTPSDGTKKYIRLALRESLGKFLSIGLCFFGIAALFLWKPFGLRQHIPFGMLTPLLLAVFGTLFAIVLQRKKPLHDRIGNTMVYKQQDSKYARIGLGFAVASLLFVLLSYAYSWYSVSQIASKMEARAGSELPAHQRNMEKLVEVGEMGEAEHIHYAEWLNSSGSSPVEYIVQKAKENRLLLLGEQHEQKETLAFFNQIIPILYKRAGVTCIGMETFMASENPAIEKLLMAPDFDHQKARELARKMDTWGAWGFKEYWQVLETVWQLNQTIPADQAKVKVIGLGVPIDVMSLSMAGLETGPGSHTPAWEKLRIARILPDLPAMYARDALMAEVAISEILDKEKKGIILIGAAHSSINCPMPGKLISSKARMGFMLSQKYPNDIFQIVCHRKYTNNDSKQTGITCFIESIMKNRDHVPVGFDIVGSPLATIRDSACWEFSDPKLGLSDIATGYVYLAPLKKINKCEWVSDYVTPSMYTSNKPFYKSWGKHWNSTITNSKDFNNLCSRIY